MGGSDLASDVRKGGGRLVSDHILRDDGARDALFQRALNHERGKMLVIQLYVWLCKNYEKEPEKADLVQTFLCMSGFTEVGLAYPLTAKYHMNLVGIPTENVARNRKSCELTDYARDCMKQMKLASDYIASKL